MFKSLRHKTPNSRQNGHRKSTQRTTLHSANHTQRKKSDLELRNHDGPLAFLIPGNHDWFDNLEVYTELFLNRSWLGGWYIFSLF